MNPRLIELSKGKCPVYVATRLFDNSGRFYGAKIEEACSNGIKKALKENKILEKGILTYLPFRDSNETVIQKDSETLTQAIYRIDCEMLRDSFALFAPIYDLHQDSGISFEIGFATAKNVPIILLAGNFFNWSVRETKTYPLEPIFTYFSDIIIEVGEFSLVDKDTTREGYFKKLDKEFGYISKKVEEEFYKFCQKKSKDNYMNIPVIETNNIHIEFGGGQYDFQEHFSKKVYEKIKNHKHSISISRRHLEENYLTGLKNDMNNMAKSKAIIFLGDGSDVDPEISFLLGYCSGKNKKNILYYSGNKHLFSPPDYLSPRNLMISESAKEIVNSLDELVEVVKKMKPVPNRVDDSTQN